MRSVTRSFLALLVVVLALAAATPVAGAPGSARDAARPAQDDDDDRVATDDFVVITGRVQVDREETVDTIFIADGPVILDGTARETVIALNGDVRVWGTAREDVIALDGRVTVADGGTIEGDVISRHRPVVEEGGRFEGDWDSWDPSAWRRASTAVGWFAAWLAVSFSLLLLGLILLLVVPRAAVAVDDDSRGRVGPVILWGIVLLIGLPVVAVLAMVTLIGLPFGLGLLLALGLIYGVGYVTGAFLLGRRIVSRSSRFVAFLVGWGILRLVALVPVLGGLAWLAAVVVGLGAIAVAGHRARGVEAREPVRPAPEPEPAPNRPTSPG